MNTYGYFIRAAILALSITSCASTTSVNQAELIVIGAKHFTNGADVFFVPTHGALGDAAFIATSHSQPSAQAQQLARTIRIAQNAPVNIVIGGPNSKKTAAVLESAISLCADAPLAQLHVVFVGQREQAQQLQKLLQAKRARFEFATNKN